MAGQVVDPASVHGLKWLDENGNEARDDGEPGLAGVTIYVDLNDNGVLDEGEPSTVSMVDDPATTEVDESGMYWLEDLESGSLTIREIVPDGFVQTFPSDPGSYVRDVGPNERVEGLDFGNQRIEPASIHGTKWVDANGNSERDPDEPGLPGVTIYIDLNDNGVLDDGEPTTVTTDVDEAGRYWFEGLRPGSYVIREVVPDGFMQTFPANGGEHRVSVESGQVLEGLNFGNQEIEPASIHGLKWSDANGDGVADPDEPGLPGVTIYLDLNGNGEFNEDEPHAVTMEDDPATDFDESGLYWLENLRPGTYFVREVVPDDFMQTFPGNGGEHEVTLESGDIVEGINFGNEEILPASVHGAKWSDSNGDGLRQEDETGLPGVTIYVDANDNGELDEDEPRTLTMEDDPETAEVDETGLYWLEGLRPGAKVIREVVPDGFVQTFPTEPDAFYLVELESGGIVEGLDFGNQETASVRGFKWLDVNGDGVPDPDEPGIPGVIIYADLNENGELNEDEPRTRTMRDDPATEGNENGEYWFMNLLPGELLIREVVPDGFTQTFPADPGFYTVELASGESIEGLDFGNALEGHKLSLCHNGHSINVDFHALPAHLMHGDWVLVDESACGNGR